MIDIHSHILPGVDDGAQTMEDALNIARRESEGGTEGMFATSHVMEHRDLDSLPMRAERLSELRAALNAEGITMTVYPGAEVFPFPGVLKAIEQGLAITLGGSRYVLFDLPLGNLPNDFDSIVFSIQARALVPILAHPERVATFQNEPERLREYVERGVPIQVNAGSVLGQYGPRAVETAHFLLDRRWPQFMASDSHRASRSPKLMTAVNALKDQYGESYLDLLTRLSPQAVVANEALPQRPPEPPIRKKRFWERWRLRRG
jgi:protein-tyrosine phosphatase